MPMGAVTLRPGIDVEQTPSLNEAGFSESQCVRFKNGMVQTLGGWDGFPSFTIPSTVKDLHAWQDVAAVDHLAVGAVNNLIVVTAGSNTDVTPQTMTTNPAPNFDISSGFGIVTVHDPNSGASIYNTVYFNTPIALGSILLNGGYQITSVLSTGSYLIETTNASCSTVASSGILPIFESSAGSPVVTVTLPNHNFQALIGEPQQFIAPTTVDGLTVQGSYTISSVIDSTTFRINAATQSSATATSTMNAGLAQLVYYITGGPAGSGTAWGAGTWGSGTWGGVGGTISPITGTPITADDWSLDNWGEILLACPKDGPVYAWSPEGGFANAQVVSTAPFFNGGLFISMPQQILVLWKSCTNSGVQANLKVRWSDAEDFSNWEISNQTSAGGFLIPTGSVIRGGLQAPNYGVIWTDVDVWLMQYVGGDVIFNFTRVGAGCGLVGQHAAGVLSGSVWWCSDFNFFTITQGGVKSIPCTVWDFIFQNINRDEVDKVFCAPNSAFNEIGWFFPSINATENDSYVKFNITENAWDYGSLNRTAWIDASILGNPIAADTGGVLWQHEEGEATAGTGSPSFRTSWWALTEGNDLAFVDYIIPDFKYELFPEPPDAEINLTFYSADYPGDIPRVHGPYTVTQATQYLTPRIRGRLLSVLVQSNNQEFWRLGRIRFRFAVSGRR